MDKDKVNQFLMVNADKFPPMMVEQMRKKLESMTEDQESALFTKEWKSPLAGFLLAFFLGCFGVDRFWLGETGSGVAKLLTCGGVGIWSLIDLFTIFQRTRNYNYTAFNMLF